jgi:hypothetical protein
MYEYVQDENMDLRILIGVKSNLIEHIVESGIELELDEFDARVGSLANFLLDNEGPELKRGLFDGLKDIEQLVIAEKDQAVESQEDVPTESILTFLTYRSYDSLLLEDKVSMIKDMYDRFEELSSENPQSIDLNEIDLVMLYLQEYLKGAYSQDNEDQRELREVSSEFFLGLKKFYDKKQTKPEDEYQVTEYGLVRPYTLADELKDRIEYEKVREEIMEIKPEVTDEWVAEQVKRDVNKKLFEALCYLHDGFPQSAMNAVGYIRRKISSMPEEQVRQHAFLSGIEQQYLIDIDKEIEGSIRKQEQKYSR